MYVVCVYVHTTLFPALCIDATGDGAAQSLKVGVYVLREYVEMTADRRAVVAE